MSHNTLLRMTEWVDEIATSSNQKTIGLLAMTFLIKVFSSSSDATKQHEVLLLFKAQINPGRCTFLISTVDEASCGSFFHNLELKVDNKLF